MTASTAGDYCLLHHYEIRIWAGRFPFQVKVKLVLPKITEVPQKLFSVLDVNPAIGRFDHCVDEDM